MARAISKQSKIINSLIAWTLGLIIFFPILWIVILSFKTEGDAIRSPLAVVISNWTFENYFVVQQIHFAMIQANPVEGLTAPVLC